MEANRFLMFYQSFDSVLKDIKKKEMSYMSEYGLRSVHLRCLLQIKQIGNGSTVTELARVSNTDKSLVSRLIKELTASGFVTAVEGKPDKAYNKKFFLTPKSEKIISDIDEDIGIYMAKARTNIPEDDMQKFYEVLASLTHNISLIACDE